MNILALTAYFAPEQYASSHLTDNYCEAFAQSGFEMYIYTPCPTRGINDEEREKYKKHLKYESLNDGKLHVYRFPLMREGKSPIKRALRYFLECFKHYYYGCKNKNADVLFVTSTPPIQGAMAALVKKKTGIPIVYNLQDIFPDSLVGTGLAKKGGLLWKIGRKIEDFTYKNADKIIVISQDFKRNIMAKGVPEGKIEVVYNWVDENTVVSVDRKDNVLFERYNLDKNKFFITYCGNIGLTQNMDMLLDVASELLSEKDIQFVLIGDGAYRHDVERIIKERKIVNVKLLPFQPYGEISYVFSLGDVGLVISKPGVGENSVPSKTWSIMSAERPVIANFDENELKTIIDDYECGIFTKAGDKDSFKQAILTLFRNREKGIEMGKNGRKFILQNLTKEIGINKYVQILKSFDKIVKD